MKKACHSAIGGSASGGNNSAFPRSAGQVCIPAKRGTSLHSAFPGAFTLIELIITIVITGIVVLALVMGFRESLIGLALQKDIRLVSLLSEDLMNEVRSKQYADPQSPTNFGPEFGETFRRQYDDVDDYNGWSESPPKTIEGVTLTNYLAFTSRAIVVNVTNNIFNGLPAPDNATNSDFKRITVIVSNAVVAVSNVSVVSRYD